MRARYQAELPGIVALGAVGSRKKKPEKRQHGNRVSALERTNVRIAALFLVIFFPLQLCSIYGRSLTRKSLAWRVASVKDNDFAFRVVS
jgi:hypothetical protein